jgi:nifR3 family TIM-barrel protein
MKPEDLLKSLKLGNIKIENRLFQAPLAGYTNMPFRLMCARHGRPGMLATEMISAKALILGGKHNEFYLQKHKEEYCLQYQLWGNEPEVLGQAAAIVQERGADAVDINCGCPVRKVNAAGAGAVIMKEPKRIEACISEMRKNASIPVSAKIRVGPTAQNWNAVEVAKLVEGAGADFITIHGRHGKERYNTPVRCEEIAKVVAAVSIPVIGNGDVINGKSAAYLVNNTGCAGVMIGRGCMGNPWIFDKIKTELAGKEWKPPQPYEIGEVLKLNYTMLVDIMGEERATRHIRKLACFYSKGFSGSREFRMEVNHCSTREEFTNLIDRLFIR